MLACLRIWLEEWLKEHLEWFFEPHQVPETLRRKYQASDVLGDDELWSIDHQNTCQRQAFNQRYFTLRHILEILE